MNLVGCGRQNLFCSVLRIKRGNPDLEAYGQRGLVSYDGSQQAWFDTSAYPDDEPNIGRQPYFPYYSSDIAYSPDASDGGIVPIIKRTIRSMKPIVALQLSPPHGILLSQSCLITSVKLHFNR